MYYVLLLVSIRILTQTCTVFDLDNNQGIS
jgi:hypothetical protein